MWYVEVVKLPIMLKNGSFMLFSCKMSRDLRRIFLLGMLVFCVPFTLSALPHGAKVAAGRAEFSKTAHQLTITASDKAIINYDSFHIGEKEAVCFVQPQSSSCVLNRVTGNETSQILGELTANGRVFLVNPNGVYFGKHSRVDVGSLVASTLDILDNDFLDEKYHFFATSQSMNSAIVNAGSIAAETSVALLAASVHNEGTIVARTGSVIVASAPKISLDFTGDGLISFAVDGDLEKTIIENGGSIQAGQAVYIKTRLASRAIREVLNTDGVEMANAIAKDENGIRLVATSRIKAPTVVADASTNGALKVSGAIDASQKEIGGMVSLQGESVDLIRAYIDASGDKGGGTVLVGGDYQGRGGEYNAKNCSMDKSSIIYADARETGKGGKVILWSDNTTVFSGKIFCRGGGEGGFVETSGKIGLRVQGHVDTSASGNCFGTWLMDPNSVNIITGGADPLASCSPPNCATAGTVTIDPTTFQDSATNVEICATNGTASSITVTNAVSMSQAGVSLMLTAGSSGKGNINLNDAITTNGGNLTMIGNVLLPSSGSLTTNGGAIRISGTTDGATGSPSSLTLASGTGSIDVGDIGNSSSTGMYNLTITNSGVANFRGIVFLAGNLVQTNPATGSTTFTGQVNIGVSMHLRGTDFFFNDDCSVFSAIQIDNAGLVTKNATNRFWTDGSFFLTGSLNLASNIIAVNAGISIGGPLTVASGRSVVISSNDSVSISGSINGTAGTEILTINGTTELGSISIAHVGTSVPLNTLTMGNDLTNGGITLTGSTYSTTGPQNYNANNSGIGTTLTSPSNTTMTGTNFSFAGPFVMQGANVNINSSGGSGVTFSNTIQGVYALNINASGAVALYGTINTGALSIITTNTGTNAIGLYANNYMTNYGQFYQTGSGGTITLTQNPTTFTSNSGGDLTFTQGAMTLPSSGTVNVLTTGGITIGPVSGGTSSIVHLQNSGVAELTGPISVGQMTFTTPSNIQLNGDLTTYTDIDFSGSITLFNNKVNIVSNSHAVRFRNTIDNKPLSTSVGLKVNAGSASVMFDALIGATSPIYTLEVTGSNVILSGLGGASFGVVNFSEITASGITLNTQNYNALNQIYKGPVTLGADITMQSYGLVSFSSTIDGPHALSIYADNSIFLSGNVGSSSALASLFLTSLGSSIEWGGTLYQTIGAQSYSAYEGALSTLTQNSTTFSSNAGGDIAFYNSRVRVPFSASVYVSTTGGITIGPVLANVGDASSIVNLQNSGVVRLNGPITVGQIAFTTPSNIQLNGNLTTYKSLDFPANVTLNSNVSLNNSAGSGSSVSFFHTIVGNYVLNISASGVVALYDTINTGALSIITTYTGTNAIGLYATNYTTEYGQSYQTGSGGTITLTQNPTTFTSNSGGNITFTQGTMTLPPSVMVQVSTTGGATIGPVWEIRVLLFVCKPVESRN